MAKIKVHRERSTTFCEYCEHPKAMGRHAIPNDLAATLPKEACASCKKEVSVACVLGLGHFFYVCENCGNKRSNLESERGFVRPKL